MIESTGYKPTEFERIDAGITHCLDEIMRLRGMLHLLQSQRKHRAECGDDKLQENYSEGKVVIIIM